VAANPCDRLELPRVPYKAKPILPVDVWAKILHEAQRSDPAFLGYLCPVLFGGLRSRESERARPEQFKNGVIDLDDGGQTKLNVRRLVKISAQLKAWLKVPGAVVGCKQARKRRRRLLARKGMEGIDWPHNCHRHSFCSYTLELKGAKEAARMANHSEQTLFANYANKVTRAEAKRFAKLRPQQGAAAHRSPLPARKT
jgi:integrase